MNIHQLRCAVTVARLGSQTRAAEALYMSQPNLSKALKELEQACGFRIFTRTGTGMVPTPRGEELLCWSGWTRWTRSTREAAGAPRA